MKSRRNPSAGFLPAPGNLAGGGPKTLPPAFSRQRIQKLINAWAIRVDDSVEQRADFLDATGDDVREFRTRKEARAYRKRLVNVRGRAYRVVPVQIIVSERAER